ncbi:dihydropteroate synthase [Mycetohabitans endofungorum]|uniref:dihydropteroate synthase n=1 Tax=Mycetohabitans endofungorum TaxID=417203 RepID=UPI003BB19E55
MTQPARHWRKARIWIRSGAHILDISSKSARPSSPAVPLEEALRRVLPGAREASASKTRHLRQLEEENHRLKPSSSGCISLADVSGRIEKGQ